MSIEDAIKEVMRMTDQNIKTIDIDGNGFYNLINTSIPKYTEKISKMNAFDNLYIIPRLGDILQEIKIVGCFKTAEIYQYCWTGSRKVLYDTIKYEDSSIIEPFGISGIPMICVGKNLYVEITDAADDVEVHVTFGYLPKECRLKLARFRMDDSDNGYGVKILHRDGSIYQFIGLNDYGFSPNYLTKIT
jgi:hypothetical protein